MKFLTNCQNPVQLNSTQSNFKATKSRLSSKIVFHQKSSSIKGCLPLNVIFHLRLSSIKGCLPSKVAFHQRLPFIKGFLPSKAFFHQRSSSIKECLPTKVVFNQTSSSIKGIFCDFDSFIKVRNILLQSFLNGVWEVEKIIPFPVYKTSVELGDKG